MTNDLTRELNYYKHSLITSYFFPIIWGWGKL